MAHDLVVHALRRHNTEKAWGFQLEGGFDQGLPVFVHKITRNGLAHKAGLEPGDVVLQIGRTPVAGMIHAQVKAEILRAGNELDFTVRKHEFNVAQYNASMQQIAAATQQQRPVTSAGPEPRVEVVEEHLWRHGGPTFKPVQPKSYKILEQQLPQANQGGPAPGSVLSRNLDERSPYLQATDNTIQKAFGQYY